MWADHSFSDRELDRWADDILEAALPLSTEGRARLLDTSCRGSDALRARVEALLADEWPESAMDVLPSGSIEPGMIVNECVILARIGSGGSGEVYKAIDTQLPRRVAVKVLSRLSSDQRAALRSEAGNLSRFTHPNIAAVYRADFEAHAPSIVMEHVSGITLREWLKQYWSSHDNAPSDDVTLALFQQMAAAVREVHQAGIVHADVKPENFLVSKQTDGSLRMKLIDFGIATLSAAVTGHVRGTPGYIAPEQIESQSTDERSDVFALGVVLFEIVFGSHPFAGEGEAETLFNTVNKEPAFGDSTTRFRRVIDRALYKQPGQRYQGVDEMVADTIAGVPRAATASFNPLLTELPAAIQQWLQVGSTGLVLAAASLIWGAISLVLSVFAHAACLRVLWSADLDPTRRFEMRYGYLVEPNAGLWYLVFTSFFVLGVFAFLRASHQGFAATTALTLDGAVDTVRVSTRIGQINRRLFQVLAVPIIVIAFGHVYWVEVVNRDSNAFGWVQADLAGGTLDKTFEELRQQGVVGDVPALSHLCPGCIPKVVNVRNTGNEYLRPEGGLFIAFLTLALLHEAFFSLVAIWVAAKIVFVFSLLTIAAMRESGSGIRLKPDFDDRDDYRFGLGRLDGVYITTFVLTALGALGFWSQKLANFGKGTYFLDGNAVAPLIGQLATVLLVVALLALLLVVPFVASLFLSVQSIATALAANSHQRKEIESELRSAKTALERDELARALDGLKRQRETVNAQSVLPTRRWAVTSLMLFNFGLILVPIAGSFFPLLRTVGDWIWNSYVELLCAACGVSPF
jgi:tRNA A-37 threonylcarbamoyl transferase component Bud32